MPRPRPSINGPQAERMNLVLLFLRAFWRMGVYNEISVADVHRYFKLFLEKLTSVGIETGPLRFLWDEATQRFELLDDILRTIETDNFALHIIVVYEYGGKEVLEVNVKAGEGISKLLHYEENLGDAGFITRRDLAELVVGAYKNKENRQSYD